MFKGISSEFGIKGSDIDRNAIETVILPNQVKQDEVPTLNRFGYMKVELDEFSREFLDFASKPSNLKSLEIGCAYGFIARQALEKGVKLIVNDIEGRHLSSLFQNTPVEKLDNLFLYQGSFPGEIDLPKASLQAVFASRVMHFLTGEDFEAGFKKIQEWLSEDGKVFFVTCTPYHYAYKDFLPIYQERVQKGEIWPGIIENQRELAPEHAPYIPDFTHVFSKEQLERLLPQYGFVIEKIKYFDYLNHDSNGQGHIGVVARKTN